MPPKWMLKPCANSTVPPGRSAGATTSSQSFTWIWSGTRMPITSASVDRLGGRHGRPAVGLGALPAVRGGPHADDHVAAGVLEVERVRVALRAVADDRDLPPAQQREIGVGVVVDLRHLVVPLALVGRRVCQARTRMRRRAGALGHRAAHGDAAGAHDFLDAVGPQQLLEGARACRGARRSRTRARSAPTSTTRAENTSARLDQLGALVGARRDLDEQQLALDRVLGGHLVDLEHVDELVELLR